MAVAEPITVHGPLLDRPHLMRQRWSDVTFAHLGRTWYIPNIHPPWRLRSARLLDLGDGLVASVGLGDSVRRPPDHVMFSDGVDARFGRPVLATTPRHDHRQ